ncbi:sensor histidine kinase [Actinacidiphila glaucinigra]|uniref:sensor histidine kinase n=1 Tax=Actinacidiphila glaucinigra TaxID=235986 RepID=UPI0029B91541|nr:histidine kinase [Streptomyces sp. PA03-3a]
MNLRHPPSAVLDGALVLVALFDVWVHVHADEPLQLACALGGAFALLLRHGRPLLTFLVTLPAVFFSDAIFASLAALYTLASVSRRRVILAVGVVAFTLCDLAPDINVSAEDLVTLSYTAATAAAAVFLGQLVQARRDLSQRIVEISEAREHERLLIAQTILAAERSQLAREMHDVVSHQVSLIAVRAGALQVGTRDTHAKEAASTIRRLSVQTLDELRYMVSVLRAAGDRPTDLTPQPSLADLERLVDGSGIEARLTADLPGDLAPSVQRALYRTVQEGLTNVRKHAPGAATTIRLWQSDETVHVTVTNGPPTRSTIPLPSAHYGLTGLRQRAALLGGTLTCGPISDGGYQLRLDLPVKTTTPAPGGAGP